MSNEDEVKEEKPVIRYRRCKKDSISTRSFKDVIDSKNAEMIGFYPANIEYWQ